MKGGDVQMITSVNSSSSSGSNSSLSDTALAKAGFSQQTFLQLLVTQLKYQDPLNPQDSSSFVSELAQFSSLEQASNTNKSIETVLEMSATNLIGKTVTALDSAGNEVTGTVEGIVYYADGPALKISGADMDIPFSSVQNVT